MAICYIGCDASLIELIKSVPDFNEQEILEVQFPITASELEIDVLIAGPRSANLPRLAATISDWNLPPAALFILPVEGYDDAVEVLRHHPRMGRSIDFCPNEKDAVLAGIQRAHTFFTKRASLKIDNSLSGNYNTNNISPRWLFQTMMEHMDEYIYFKDSESKFLAVSRYLSDSCGKDQPSDVLGMRDFDFFDRQHAEDAYHDERKIATGEIGELYKEEQILKDGKVAWVASRKLPLHTRSNSLAGSFGLSRDVTEEKELHQKLERNHERMQSELLLARNLQSTLMQQSVPTFDGADGAAGLELATKYIPSFHLSGDFFSIIKTKDGGAAILVADVMGHGVRAAMVTAMIQIAVQQLQDYACQPAEFMTRLNEMMRSTLQPIGETIFATAVYSYIDLDKKQLTYAQAGARHGIYVPSASNEAVVFESSSISPALGLIPDVQFAESTQSLEAGDEIILYTDGIIEAAMGDEEYSEKRMINFLMEHRRDNLPDMLNELLNSVATFTKTKELDDDVCLIGLRVL
ncbi:MAG: SpoIIE family protein phosphatase [Opitutales bacterium]|nr:SpoIIE family protein phosphatase [Opitutales bacterium]MDP4777505.1 SpoIIE family protein phosphatase [Opitutales bacterium]MDP5080925.1 SpoIIE family protein phosphatase [Opitutales bacterium]